jgi:hypothetical protein
VFICPVDTPLGSTVYSSGEIPGVVQYLPSAQLTEHLVHTEALSPLYFPDSHSMHALAPDTFEYVPDVQLVHAEEELAPAVVEYVPAGHATHVLALLAPETPENAAAGHDTHTFTLLAPVTPEYAPAAQFVHALEVLAPVTPEYFPGPQSVHTAAPAAAYFPVAHPTQLVDSTLTLNLPASQSVQPTPTTYLPATQGPLQTLAPASEVCPTGQLVQTMELVAPITFENFPDEHSLHVLRTTSPPQKVSKYFPTGQSKQLPIPLDPSGEDFPAGQF